MNKKILITTVLATVSGVTHAQSSVSLYGLIDSGISYVSHTTSAEGSSHLFKFGDGVASGNRWGLRGTEDLGGGLKVIFVLESGFNSGTGALGQGNSLFGRQAYVGLTKNDIGSVTFGRQYSSNTDFLQSFSTGGNTVAGNYAYHLNDVDQLTSSRISNAVKFTSADYAGLTFGGLYGFSNQAGAFAGAPVAGGSRAYSFGANYKQGPFSVGTAYIDIKYPGFAAPTTFSTSLANASLANIRDLRSFGVGGRYVVGPTSLWALWTNTLFSPPTGSSTLYNAYDFGGKYAFTPALSGALGYTYSRASGSFGGHWNQVNAAVDYSLSKRTDVYLLAIYQKASGTLPNGSDLQAQIGDSSSGIFQPSGTGATNQVATRVGIRHRF